MNAVEINIAGLSPHPEYSEVEKLLPEALAGKKLLLAGKGAGSDFLGWLRLPEEGLEPALYEKIMETAAGLRDQSRFIVVVGIGGSYLGARAAIDALGDPFDVFRARTGMPSIIYAGHQIGEDYHCRLLEFLADKDYSVIVISKSGTTTEPALAFRLLKSQLYNRYGRDQARRRIVAITDSSKGALHRLAVAEGYRTFVIPDDVGGRFSVLSPVGLLPVAAAGFDIKAMLNGALNIKQMVTAEDAENNPACIYAAARNALYRNGKTTEILVNFLPSLVSLTEWWKQLFGESEGKERKGIFPAGLSFSTDLHSLGQYVQDGSRILFETMLWVENPSTELRIPEWTSDDDGLNFLAGKRIHEVNRMAWKGTSLAHSDGGVPVITISIPASDAYHLGAIMYFFEFSCAISGYMLGVNPFDQPGVEAYKNNMFALLGKKGYEELSDQLRKRI